MFFFDYLYYVIYKFYSRKEKGAASSAAGIIGGLQSMNCITFIALASYIISFKIFNSKILYLIIIIFFQITTYIRYIYKEDNSIPKIEDRWLKLPEEKRINIRGFGIGYIVFSVLVFFGLMIYIGTKKR